jgi:hypothetical protein
VTLLIGIGQEEGRACGIWKGRVMPTFFLQLWCRLRGHPYPTKTGKIGRLVPGVWSEQIEYVDQPVCSGCWEKI